MFIWGSIVGIVVWKKLGFYIKNLITDYSVNCFMVVIKVIIFSSKSVLSNRERYNCLKHKRIIIYKGVLTDWDNVLKKRFLYKRKRKKKKNIRYNCFKKSEYFVNWEGIYHKSYMLNAILFGKYYMVLSLKNKLYRTRMLMNDHVLDKFLHILNLFKKRHKKNKKNFKNRKKFLYYSGYKYVKVKGGCG